MDSLEVKSKCIIPRLGMMRTVEGGLHYFINGEDQGLAIDGVPSGVYAVIDLYGVCGQVRKMSPPLNKILFRIKISIGD